MSTYTLVMPDGLEDDAWLFETKGWLPGIAIVVGDVRYEPDFYDPVRYAQTLADDVEVDGFAVPENVVVVSAVTPTEIRLAVERLAATGFASLRPVSGLPGPRARPNSGHAVARDGDRDGSRVGGTEAAETTKKAIIHFDGGGLSPGPVTAACTVELSDGSLDQAVEHFDEGTHNTAEWQAFILGLRVALKHGERHVLVKGDSLIVVKQITREWKTKSPALQSLRAQADDLLALFETWRVEWIPRKENHRADKLGRAR